MLDVYVSANYLELLVDIQRLFKTLVLLLLLMLLLKMIVMMMMMEMANIMRCPVIVFVLIRPI